MSTLAWVYWNPPRTLFTIPFFDHPVAIYGLCFVTGFVLGYFIICYLFYQRLLQSNKFDLQDRSSAKSFAFELTDRLTGYIVAGTILGARLFHVMFYDWSYYQEHPLEILAIWKGGLASHGGACGVLIALYFYYLSIRKRFPDLSLIFLIDALAVPSALAGCFIRIGNFFNQEILGFPTTHPWGIIFGDPMDGGPLLPRHPVQLYEAASYLLLFFLLIYLWFAKKWGDRPGFISGTFFILLFSARFGIEFLKTPQNSLFNDAPLQAGQILSIPFIFLGFILLRYGNRLKMLHQR